MSDTSNSDQLVRDPLRGGDVGAAALVGFLAGYSGPTRDSYRTDLRLFTVWLADREVGSSTSSGRRSTRVRA
jgi:hypothetical protein